MNAMSMISVTKHILKNVPVFAVLICLRCSVQDPACVETGRDPPLTPDYCGITLPPNIAPINFTFDVKAEKYRVIIRPAQGKSITIASNDRSIIIPAGKWKTCLADSKGKNIAFEVMVKQHGTWTKFNTITNRVVPEPIDRYLVYRLIEPGFVLWNKMGIYQRCLENFNESPVMVNDVSERNCINCHSFCRNSAATMMFHMRSKHSGTIIYRNGKLTKINTQSEKSIGPGVYPAWHPNGKLIAFSVNKIIQRFHAAAGKKIEVQDTLSHLVIYDVEGNRVSSCTAISTPGRLETFPCWSPDGRFLYFCSAKAVPIEQAARVRYDVLRIAFDAETVKFGAVDTVVSSNKTGLSASFPRISPDGKFLLFCMSSYGNFSIWHAESDLYLLNLKTGWLSKPAINSTQSESYHGWSSNGRWIVFASRRIDGLFTRLYFSYFDSQGIAHKPFLLPQKNPAFYRTFLKSYNVPELVTARLELNPHVLDGVVNAEAVKASE